MRMQHTFELPGSVPDTLDLLSRIDEIAPCLPGASATRAGDDRFDGTVRLRLGPLDMSFRGTISIEERDHAAGRAVLKSRGSEARGQGTAAATTVAMLTAVDDRTRVVLETDLVISGRVAQMGRGMVVEVSNDLLERFVANLNGRFAPKRAATFTAQAPSAAPPEQPSPGESSSTPTSPEVRPYGPAPQPEQYLSVGGIFWRVLRRRFLALIDRSTAP